MAINSGSTPVNAAPPRAIWEFGQTQSEDYAARVSGFESIRQIGTPTFARDNATVQDVIGIVPELSNSPYLRIPAPLPFADFSLPPEWIKQFRPLFSPAGLITSFGNERDVELSMANVQATQVNDQSQKRQKGALTKMFELYSELGDMLHEIRGRMGQFIGA
jgi:hypothetical protein